MPLICKILTFAIINNNNDISILENIDNWISNIFIWQYFKDHFILSINFAYD